MLVPNPASSGFESRLDDPALFLNPHTENELRYLRFADKVTVDLHKSGYTPFPAGALCYRDGLLRFLVTWKSPVTGSVEADAMEMGIYGLEGRCVHRITYIQWANALTFSSQQTRCSTVGRLARA
jgi:glutamate/tyrosine decarboxylase-like PLP-dependent enzyme